MIETVIKEGVYSKIEDVIVVITETITETKINANEVSERLILDTIQSLVNKKKQICDDIDAEIATNNALLFKVRGIDRTHNITV